MFAHYLVYSVLADLAGNVHSLGPCVLGFTLWNVFTQLRLERTHLQFRSPDEDKHDILYGLSHLIGRSKKNKAYAKAQWKSFKDARFVRIYERAVSEKFLQGLCRASGEPL